MIDGSGAAGISAAASGVGGTSSSTLVAIEIEFDADALGFLPTAVGMVLTDGAGPASGLFAYDRFGNETVFRTDNLDLIGSDTTDDRFLGILNPDGIVRIWFAKERLKNNFGFSVR